MDLTIAGLRLMRTVDPDPAVAVVMKALPRGTVQNLGV
jgi:hypothetical protein